MNRPTDISSLLHSQATEVAHIELTSRCNLRCVYCALSQPGYQSTDLDPACLPEVLDTLEERRIQSVFMNGHGETTIVKGWNLICDQMLDRGFRLSIVSNFARLFNPQEVATLSRFAQVCVSCDTVDPELFTALRRKAKLSVLLDNMAAIRKRCREEDLPEPRLSWSAVISDQTVMGLMELARKGLEAGVKHFEFCNLTKYPDPPNALSVQHVCTMSVDKMREARRVIQATLQLIDHGRARWSLQSGLLDALDQHLSAGSSEALQPAQEVTRYSAEASHGETRLCLDPWKMLYVHADGTVRTCCWDWDGMGNLKQGETLASVANNDKIGELRRQLLTGELPHFCAQCPARPVASLQEEQAAVIRLLSDQAAAPPGAFKRWRQLRRLRNSITVPLVSITKTVRRWRS